MKISKANLVRDLLSRIESDIANRKFEPGSVVGTESELCARYGASPTILRQAARLLEASDVAEMRPGNGGGLVVNGYSLEGAAKTVATYLEFRGADVADVTPLGARVMAVSARIAGECMSLETADIVRAGPLRMAEARTGFERGMVLVEAFQRLVAAANNPILTLIDRVAAHFLTDVTPFDTATRDAFEAAAEGVSELMEAAICADIPRLDQLVSEWTRNWREANDAITEERAAPAAKERRARPAKPPSEDALETGGPSRTLSDQLARRLLHEIRSMNWPVGRRLGDEPELLARYGVSRATFRQAVRLLEQYFAVETRRGPGGGLFVTSPDPGRVNDLTVATLIYAGVDRIHIQEARTQIISLAFDLALARGKEGGEHIRAMLRDAQAEALRDPLHTRRALHREIGRASASRFTDFALDILLLLGARLRGAQASSMNAGRVGYLLEQAAWSFEVGDYARAKRALIDLTKDVDARREA
jgi:DNA-binding FadR family transcriptional regulator